MQVSMTRDGAKLRIEWRRSLVSRLASLVFFAPALYLARFLIIGLREDFVGFGNLREDLPGLVVLVAIVLAIAAPGYVLATFRYVVEIDKASGAVAAIRSFGPLLRIRSPRKLAEFTRITIVGDLDPGDSKQRSWFPVNLCGDKRTRPLEVASFPVRKDADDFGKQLGAALGLKAEDLVDTDADDPDLQDGAKS